MKTIFPSKLKEGDEVRVIAPARSAAILSPELRGIAGENLRADGLSVSFGEHINERDVFDSSSIKSRIADLHAAFEDKGVRGILTAIGGFNSNQLLRHVDWDLLANNPKIFCGYSDITALGNAIYAKTGMVTYSGLHYSTFGQRHLQDYNTDHFRKCLFSDTSFEIVPSNRWSDDAWYKDQDKRTFNPNEGWWVLREGEARGTALGGNAGTLRLLYGTEYMPDLTGSILFLEDDHYTDNDVAEFDRSLQSLIHQDGFEDVRGILIGRFQKGSRMTRELLTEIVDTKQELRNIPIIANIDFGHTDPLITFPIGGTVEIESLGTGSHIRILEH